VDLLLDRTLQEVVDLIPSGWQFPEITCARLTIGDKEYRSVRYAQGEWILSENIVVDKESVGIVDLAYAERRPECLRGPFLREEVFLLEAIASLIGQSIQRIALEVEKIKLFREVQKKYEKILSGLIPILRFMQKYSK